MAQEQMNDFVIVEIDKARELAESYEKRTKHPILIIIIINVVYHALFLVCRYLLSNSLVQSKGINKLTLRLPRVG